jgi:hypothetical protein
VTEEPTPDTAKSRLPTLVAGVAIAAAIGGGLWLTEPKPPNPTHPSTTATPASSPTTTATLAQTTNDATQSPAPPAPPLTPGNFATASAGGSAINFADDSLAFSVALPPGPADDPVLAYLRRDSEGYLKTMKANARADFNRIRKTGAKPAPWEVHVQWKLTAKAGDIVSLAGEASEYAGGAHPIEHFDTHIARTSGAEVRFDDMLQAKKNPSPALTIALCEALKSAKIARIKSATVMDEPIVCAGLSANSRTELAKLALAPSNQPGKFGGVYAYYEPYSVGAYAEGAYRLTVQQAVFAEDLKPEFKALFAGEAPELAN